MNPVPGSDVWSNARRAPSLDFPPEATYHPVVHSIGRPSRSPDTVEPQSTIMPSVGDRIQFLPDSTVCQVIAALMDVEPQPLFILRHPQLGDLLATRTLFHFPLGADLGSPAPKHICADCHWYQSTPLQPSGELDTTEEYGLPWDQKEAENERQHIAVCHEPKRVARSPLDYVTGRRIPLMCYAINSAGGCTTFQQKVPDVT